jgi:hypothetical protein
MKCSEEQKIKYYDTYSNLKQLSAQNENLLGKLLKALSKIVYLVKNQQSRSSDLNELEIYNSIDASLKTNAKLITNCLKVFDKVSLFIEQGHTRFIMKFFELNAFELVLKVLSMLQSKWRQHEIHVSMVRFYRVLINHEVFIIC